MKRKPSPVSEHDLGRGQCDTVPCCRACINDVRKIKIGKNQNQNWVLIGRGSKPPDYASLFFGKSLPNQRSPQGK